MDIIACFLSKAYARPLTKLVADSATFTAWILPSLVPTAMNSSELEALKAVYAQVNHENFF